MRPSSNPGHGDRRPPGQTQSSTPAAPDEEADTARAGSGAEVLEDLLEPVVATLGFEVIAVELVGRGRTRIFRVYLDRLDEAEQVTLDDCTKMGRVISTALDAAEASADSPGSAALRSLLADPYTLEVSSPGIERALTKLAHFERFIGSRVVVRTRRAIPGATGENARQRVFHGTIAGAVADAAPSDPRRGTVRVRALDSERVDEIPLTAIKRANLVYEG